MADEDCSALRSCSKAFSWCPSHVAHDALACLGHVAFVGRQAARHCVAPRSHLCGTRKGTDELACAGVLNQRAVVIFKKLTSMYGGYR